MTESVDKLQHLGAKQDDLDDWVGLAAFDESGNEEIGCRLIVNFASENDRVEFTKALGASEDVLRKKTVFAWTMWWPFRDKEDLKSLRFGEQLDIDIP